MGPEAPGITGGFLADAAQENIMAASIFAARLAAFLLAACGGAGDETGSIGAGAGSGM